MRSIIVCCYITLLAAQAQGPFNGPREPGQQLKQSQIDDILEDDHKKSVEDSEEIRKLAGELTSELNKNDSHVLSLSALKKAEDIEKLAKRIQSRMKRY
jgi:hypothetical protein